MSEVQSASKLELSAARKLSIANTGSNMRAYHCNRYLSVIRIRFPKVDAEFTVTDCSET